MVTKLIERITMDGIRLSVEPPDWLVYSGPREAVDRWLPVLRQRKAEILKALREAENDAGDGVIRNHARGGEGCRAFLPRLDPELERRIKQMGRRWGYRDDELTEVLGRAARNPDAWRAVIEADEALLNERRGSPWSLKSD